MNRPKSRTALHASMGCCLVVLMLGMTAPESEPRTRNERRADLPATVSGALTIDETLAYLKSYYTTPPTGTSLGTLVNEFGMEHDRHWAKDRIEEIVWRLALAAPIWCIHSLVPEEEGCRTLPEMTCIPFRLADLGNDPGFCFPRADILSTIHHNEGYKYWMKAYASYLESVKSVCSTTSIRPHSHPTNPNPSPSLQSFCADGSLEPAKHLFAFIKIFPRPGKEVGGARVAAPVGVSSIELEHIWIPDVLLKDYTEFWLGAMQDWKEQYVKYNPTPNPTVVADMENALTEVRTQIIGAQPNYEEIGIKLNKIMGRAESRMRLPCDPSEYPCSWPPPTPLPPPTPSPTPVIGGMDLPGLRCIPLPRSQ
jgi:hypothetical protein